MCLTACTEPQCLYKGALLILKMDVKERAEGCVWINLVHDSDQQQQLVDVLLNIRFTKRKRKGNFWLAERLLIVLRRTMLCELRSVSS